MLSLTTRMSAALAAAALASSATAQESGRKFSIPLTGQAELTAGANLADMDGSGTAAITVNVGQQQVCWDLSVSNLDALNAAHIHRGAATASGPPVVTFFHFGQPVVLKGCTSTPQDRALLRELLQNPEAFYVNVHTTVYPAGAIRGQMSK